MIELLVAYLLWEGGAGAEWWTVFALLCMYKIYRYMEMRRALKNLSVEMEQAIKRNELDD